MKYNITYSCGHEGVVTLFGKQADRDKMIKFYEEKGICPDCYKAEQNAIIDEEAANYNLPELEGTDKQVAWAKKIRHEFLGSYKKIWLTRNTEDKQQNARAFYDKFFAETSAAKWIRMRYDTGVDSLKEKMIDFAFNMDIKGDDNK